MGLIMVETHPPSIDCSTPDIIVEKIGGGASERRG